MARRDKEKKKASAGPKVTFADGDDWNGLYVDGELVAENHSLRPTDVLDALGIVYERVACDQDWLEEQGRLPPDLKDVKRSSRG